MYWEVHYNDEHHDFRKRNARDRAGLRLDTLPRVPETTVTVLRGDRDYPDGPIVDGEWSYDWSGNYRPGAWTGRCSCGRPPVDTERQWEVELSISPDPDDTVPGYRYTGAEWDEPVCYPVTGDRFQSAPWRAHCLSEAVMHPDPGMYDRLLSLYQTTHAELSAAAERDIADWITRGRPSAKQGGRVT